MPDARASCSRSTLGVLISQQPKFRASRQARTEQIERGNLPQSGHETCVVTSALGGAAHLPSSHHRRMHRGNADQASGPTGAAPAFFSWPPLGIVSVAEPAHGSTGCVVFRLVLCSGLHGSHLHELGRDLHGSV